MTDSEESDSWSRVLELYCEEPSDRIRVMPVIRLITQLISSPMRARFAASKSLGHFFVVNPEQKSNFGPASISAIAGSGGIIRCTFSNPGVELHNSTDRLATDDVDSAVSFFMERADLLASFRDQPKV